MMEQVRLCAVWAHGELAWHFQNHIQGWMNDLNMILSCFREKMPEPVYVNSSKIEGRMTYHFEESGPSATRFAFIISAVLKVKA